MITVVSDEVSVEGRAEVPAEVAVELSDIISESRTVWIRAEGTNPYCGIIILT